MKTTMTTDGIRSIPLNSSLASIMTHRTSERAVDWPPSQLQAHVGEVVVVWRGGQRWGLSGDLQTLCVQKADLDFHGHQHVHVLLHLTAAHLQDIISHPKLASHPQLACHPQSASHPPPLPPLSSHGHSHSVTLSWSPKAIQSPELASHPPVSHTHPPSLLVTHSHGHPQSPPQPSSPPPPG